MKTLRGLAAFLIVMAGLPLFSQAASVNGKINPLYDSTAVVQRLSYDNFKNIRILYTAIVNFGGGEAEFNKLVDGYAEASSYYFSRDYDKAAEAFTRNEKAIKETAVKLAEKYKKDATDLNKELFSFQAKKKIKLSMETQKYSADYRNKEESLLSSELMMKQGSEALKRANDELERAHPALAIIYYRRSKERSISFYEVLGEKEVNNQKIEERFAREKADNMNKKYIAKEKKN